MKMKQIALVLMLWPAVFAANAQQLVHPSPSKEAVALKAYMEDVYGRQIISGQYWDT